MVSEKCLAPLFFSLPEIVPGSGGAWDAVVFVHGVVCGFLDAALVPGGGEVAGSLGGSSGDGDGDDGSGDGSGDGDGSSDDEDEEDNLSVF